MTSHKKHSGKKSARFKWLPILIVVGVIVVNVIIYVKFRTSLSENRVFSLSLLALLAGLFFESFRISDNKKLVVLIFGGTYLFSFISFSPGKHEYIYSFEEHLHTWPYFFIFIYTICFATFHKNHVTARLTEGFTLLLSVSFIYWVTDYGFINYQNLFSIVLIVTGLILSIFTIINALTYIPLTRAARLTLSIWSTIIMFAFAADNIIRVSGNPDIEDSPLLAIGLYIGLQYFLLGVSLVYIMQNYIMLIGFLPNRNGNYREDLKELVKDHIERYSSGQANIKYSILSMVFTGSVYWMNYTFQVLPRHTMIWLVFFTFQLLIHLTRTSKNISPAEKEVMHKLERRRL